MSCSIHLLPAAEDDFRHIYQYIEDRSPQGARRWRQAFLKALAKLRENPLFCGFAPESEALEIELRQVIFSTQGKKRYRAVFRTDAERVMIYRIRGPGQAPLSPDQLHPE